MMCILVKLVLILVCILVEYLDFPIFQYGSHD